MRQYIFTALTAVLFAANVSPAFGGWNIMTADDYEGSTGYWSHLELDSIENPHIIYRRPFFAEELVYAYYNFHSAHPSWGITTVIEDRVYGYSLALDENDMPHISFYDTFGGRLMYIYHDGDTWNTSTVDRFAYIESLTSIAIDQKGNPHIAYYDGTNDDLKYAYWTGSFWAISVVDSVGDVGKYCSLELSSNDYPHITYKDDTNHWLKYAFKSGSTWRIYEIDDVSNPGGGCLNDLELDAYDRPHVAYQGYPALSTYSLKYAYWTTRTWITTTVDDSCQVKAVSLALDSDDYAHISYNDNDNDDLKYAYKYGSSWAISVVSDYASYSGTSIEVNSEDEPRISFDMYLGCPVHHLGYAYYVSLTKKGEMTSTPPSAFTLGPATPNPMVDTGVVAFALPHACDVDLSLFDIIGRNIQTLASGYFEPGEHKAEISGLSSGVY
ncbi:MAG: hypothetical protein GY771_00360, partial [bacterium]|nr:hypothetical protein [bacterium]